MKRGDKEMRTIVIEAIVTKESKNFTAMTQEWQMLKKYSNGSNTTWTIEIDSVELGIVIMKSFTNSGIGYKVWAFENGKLLPLNDSEKQEYGKPIYMEWKKLIA